MFWRSLSDEIANYVGVLIFGVLAAPTIQGQAVFGEEKFTVSPFVGATGHDEIEAGPGIDLLTRPAFGLAKICGASLVSSRRSPGIRQI